VSRSPGPGSEHRRGHASYGGGVTKSVSLALVPEAGVGDYVIVHVGFAISKLDEEAARRTLETYADLAASGSSDAVD
jgi:hydrogenase expression/formation protein HypC